MSGIDISIPALIERVKAAKKADRILDDHILHRFSGACGHGFAPRYTSDLGAVETFVERHLPGCYWFLAKGKVTPSGPMYAAKIWLSTGFTKPSDSDAEHGASPALAFLLAALMALQVKEERVR